MTAKDIKPTPQVDESADAATADADDARKAERKTGAFKVNH